MVIYFFIGFFIILFSLFLGYFLSRPLLRYNINDENYGGIGYVAVGLISLVTIVSIIVTHGHTFNVFFLLIYLIKLDRKYFLSNLINKIDYSIVLKYFCVYLVVFAIQSSFYYSFDNLEVKIADQDIFYYSRLASSLFRHAGEHTFFDDPAAVNHISVYHYFDLWICGFISELLGVPAYLILIFVVYPLMTFILIFVLLSLIEFKFVHFGVKVLLVLFLLGFGAVYYSWYSLHDFLGNFYLLFFDNMPYTYYGRKLLPLLIVFGFITKYYSNMSKDDSAPYLLFFIGVLIYPAVMLLPFTMALLLDFVIRKWHVRNLILFFKRNVGVYLLLFFLLLFVALFAYNSRDESLISQSLFRFENKINFVLNLRLSLVKLFYFMYIFICSYLLHALLVLVFNAHMINYRMSAKKYSFLIYYFISGVILYATFYFYDAMQFITCNLAFLNLLLGYFILRGINVLIINRSFGFKHYAGFLILVLILVSNIHYHLGRQKLPLINICYKRQNIELIRTVLKNQNCDFPIEYYNTNSIFPIPLFRDFFILDFLGYNNFIKGNHCALINDEYTWNSEKKILNRLIVSNKSINFGMQKVFIDKSFILNGPRGKEFYYVFMY